MINCDDDIMEDISGHEEDQELLVNESQEHANQLKPDP